MSKGKGKRRAAAPSILQDLLALVIIIAIGGLMHFTWERVEGIGALRWLAVLVPVNESNWEHGKMATWPLLVWALLMLFKRKGVRNLKEWMMPTALAVWSAFIVMFSLHSAVPLAFGEIGLIKNIGTFALGIAHGVMVFRISSRWAFSARALLLGALLLLGNLAMLVIFTYYPPHIPLFIDIGSGLYGILP
jgi:hypothetical protein